MYRYKSNKRKEMTRKVVNLTDRPFNCYDSLGNLITIEPTSSNGLPSMDWNIVYVVDQKTYDSALGTGRGTLDLAKIVDYGVGNGEMPLHQVFTYDSAPTQVIPLATGVSA